MVIMVIKKVMVMMINAPQIKVNMIRTFLNGSIVVQKHKRTTNFATSLSIKYFIDTDLSSAVNLFRDHCSKELLHFEKQCIQQDVVKYVIVFHLINR